MTPTASEKVQRLQQLEADRDAYIAEIAEMIEHLWQEIDDEEMRAELARREFLAAWRIFRKRHWDTIRGPSYCYHHATWRDAIARRMGWLHGRRGDGEWVLQRHLEDAGQTRIPGA